MSFTIFSLVSSLFLLLLRIFCLMCHAFSSSLLIFFSFCFFLVVPWYSYSPLPSRTAGHNIPSYPYLAYSLLYPFVLYLPSESIHTQSFFLLIWYSFFPCPPPVIIILSTHTHSLLPPQDTWAACSGCRNETWHWPWLWRSSGGRLEVAAQVSSVCVFLSSPYTLLGQHRMNHPPRHNKRLHFMEY